MKNGQKVAFCPPVCPPALPSVPPQIAPKSGHPAPATGHQPGKLFLHLLPNAHTVTDHQRQPHQHRKRVSAMATPFGLVPSACQLSTGLWIVESCPQILCITPPADVPAKSPAHGRASGWWCRQWLPHAVVTQAVRPRKPHTAPALAGTAGQCRGRAGLDQRPGMWGRWRGGLATPLTPPATVHQSGTRHPA